MESTFKIECGVNQDYIDSLLTTAFEGGCNYWGFFNGVSSIDDAPVTLNKEDLDAHEWYASKDGRWEYRFGDVEEDRMFKVGEKVIGIGPRQDAAGQGLRTESKYRHLNLKTLQEGLQLYSDCYGFPPIDEVDAGVADSIIQCAVFGTLVYG